MGAVLTYIGITRESFAGKVGVSVDSVNSWCSGRARLRLDHLARLIHALQDSGAPPDLLRRLLVGELGRHGLPEEVLRLLGGTEKTLLEGEHIVFVGSQLTTAAQQMIMLGFDNVVRSRSIEQVLYLDTCGRSDVLEHYLAVSSRSSIGRLILALPELVSSAVDRLVRHLAIRGVRCVFVDFGLEAAPSGTRAVKVDNVGAAAMAAAFLWSRGHRDILAVAVDGSPGQQERVRGFRQTLDRTGANPRVVWTLGTQESPRSGTTADRPDVGEAAELIAADKSVSAILALSSHSAKPLIRSLRNRGRVPGEDIAFMVLGCWDWMHDVAFPPITHVALPYYEVGQQAARFALDTAAPEPGRHQVVMSPAGAIHWPDSGSVTTITSR